MKVIKPITTDTLATHARASTATYFNQAGVMQTAAVNEMRQNTWNPETSEFTGMLIEPARTNLLLNSATLSTQTRSVTGGASYVLSFWGTGSITLSGVATGTLTGTGAYPSKRVSLPFLPLSSGSLTLTVSGTVQYAQLEQNTAPTTYAAVPTSYIPTTGTTVTRAEDVVTGTGLLITSFTEPTATYSAATTYAVGNTVRFNTRLYESQVASNLNNAPDISPAQWLDTGPDNVFAMFDRQVGRASTASAPGLQLVSYITPTPVNAVALMRVSASYCKVVVNNARGTLSTQTNLTSATAQVFSGFTDGTVVTVLLNNGASLVSLVELVGGMLHELGATNYGLSMGITDYSKKGYDVATRESSFIEGPYAQRISAVVTLKKEYFNAVYAVLVSLRARPSVWIATDDAAYSEGAIAYAFFQDFYIVIPRVSDCTCNLELLGLT